MKKLSYQGLIGFCLSMAILFILLAVGCPKPPKPAPPPSDGDAASEASSLPPEASPIPMDALPDGADASTDAGGTSTVAVYNMVAGSIEVHLSFGPASAVKGFSFCIVEPSGCHFSVAPKQIVQLPLGGKFFNATFAFGAPPSCGTTIAEITANQPGQFDTADVSLVNGFSNHVLVEVLEPGVGSIFLGPPVGKDGNAKVFGLYPYGCDICTGRQKPPCGIPVDGGPACKAGTQYKPEVPCQYQGVVRGGGERYLVTYKG